MGVMCSFLLFAEDFRGLSVTFAIAIYPRKGTETKYDVWLAAYLSKLQFIPARGRKQVDSLEAQYLEKIAIYPRKGTET